MPLVNCHIHRTFVYWDVTLKFTLLVESGLLHGHMLPSNRAVHYLTWPRHITLFSFCYFCYSLYVQYTSGSEDVLDYSVSTSRSVIHFLTNRFQLALLYINGSFYSGNIAHPGSLGGHMDMWVLKFYRRKELARYPGRCALGVNI